MIEPFPLRWPEGWPREQFPKTDNFIVSLATAQEELLKELRLLGATSIVISSNAVRLRNGDLAARQPYLADTGVAVYFTLRGENRVIPCDRWKHLAGNVRAIGLTVAALRGIARWGAREMVDAAFAGFSALPEQAGGSAWWDVLGLAPTASLEIITKTYKAKAKELHPDVGGDAAAFAELSAAYHAAKEQKE